ncbi:hypothetical protein [Hwangdonia lutea]|uniref:Outer membrane protein beta-barrel domain-containing protein n=1 Tax=Hwangdonia lutea TaxID=3075823 RepID=A0AA97HRR9_9FLAO|nr:hypothetical protein [Hwangdonia sp. SCSIO 19198]WOD44325.1 hypothetical protein RNZ46_03465 [Hwangdonia sp. SCSIO 19198]
MQTITKYLALAVLCLNVHLITAQDTISNTNNQEQIKTLRALKDKIKTEERELLKTEVEAINKQLDGNEITFQEAEKLKKEAAKKHALNIENRIAIINNKLSLLQRNDSVYNSEEAEADDQFVFRIGKGETDDEFIFFGTKRRDKHRHRKYDRRTTSDLVLAFGLNNAIVEGDNLDNSPYKFGGSRFFEIGWAWKTRVFKNSNFLRFKYGYSFQINGLKPTDNQYFVSQGNQTMLDVFPENLKKSKLSITNLVFPVHFEFGPSKKIEKDDYFRYSTRNKFKIGLGGYAGFNIGTRQKLKYSVDGNRQKDKIKGGLNTTNLVYGISSYIAVGSTALYVKYDLSPIFKDQIADQNNISLGVRFDMD